MPRQSAYLHTALLLCASLPLIIYLRLQLSDTTGHMDEYDYLFVGKTLLAGDQWPSHRYMFGWDVSWFALAWGDSTWGGLVGARAVAAILGAFSLAGIYVFVYVLWKSTGTALLAMILMGLNAAHLYASQIATYDIFSLTAFIWSLPAIILACRSSSKTFVWTACASALVIIAVLSKYLVVLYLPLLAAIVLWASPKQALLGISIITAALVSYTYVHLNDLQVLYEIQIKGAHSANANHKDILTRIFNQLWLLLSLCGIAMAYAVYSKHVNLRTLLILCVFATPIGAYHFYATNVISLQKHLVFSSVFLIPIAAWGLNRFYESYNRSHVSAAILTLVFASIAASNTHNLSVMKASYPDVRQFASYAAKINETHTVLSEDPYLFRYWLYDRVDQAQIKETTWLDNNNDGMHEFKDVKQAIWDQKFDFVYINDQQHNELNESLRTMLALRNYEPLVTKTYRLQTMSGAERTGEMGLYRLRLPKLSALPQD